MRRIALFDIDGTLLSSQGAGRRALERALVERFGTPGPSHYRYDGKTDRQIIRELLRAEGYADDAIDAAMDEVLARYLEHLAVEIRSREVAPCPGIPALLDAVDAADDLVLGLLTGNIADGAAVKLLAAGLDVSRFVVGAFGSDAEHRPALPPIAQARAAALLGREVSAADLVVIGDTPLDIACAHVNGAKAIAVATGHFDAAALAAHRAEAVFHDCGDTEAVLAAIRSV